LQAVKENNKVNNDFLEEKAPPKEGIEFIVKDKFSQYAEYIDHDFQLKATLPAGGPFIYEFNFRSVIKYPPDNSVSEQDNNVDKEEIKSVLMDRDLIIRYKFEGDDLDRNRIIIMSAVRTAPIDDFGVKADKYKQTRIELNSGRKGTLRIYETEDSIKLAFAVDYGHVCMMADFSKAAYEEAKNAIMDIILSLDDCYNCYLEDYRK